MKSKKNTKNKSRAQAMVEFAIALPILLMLLYGILEAGRLMFLYSTVVTASRQAVRFGSATGEMGLPMPTRQWRLTRLLIAAVQPTRGYRQEIPSGWL